MYTNEDKGVLLHFKHVGWVFSHKIKVLLIKKLSLRLCSSNKSAAIFKIIFL